MVKQFLSRNFTHIWLIFQLNEYKVTRFEMFELGTIAPTAHKIQNHLNKAKSSPKRILKTLLGGKGKLVLFIL